MSTPAEQYRSVCAHARTVRPVPFSWGAFQAEVDSEGQLLVSVRRGSEPTSLVLRAEDVPRFIAWLQRVFGVEG